MQNADWWLQVSCLTSLMSGGFVYEERDIALRLGNGIHGINLSGEDEDFRLLAEQLKLVFPRLDELVMKLRVPATVDLGPFFRALQAETWRFNFTGAAAADQHVVSLLESTVLNQTARDVDIDNKLSDLELSQLKLLGEGGTPVEPNTALLRFSFELELHKDNAPAAADRLAKYLRRFRNVMHIEISGNLDAS